MSLIARTKGELTDELNKKDVTVVWLPDLTTKHKFSYNTNIRHEDEMGNDLDLKTIDELCEEFKHCGSGTAAPTELVLLFHNVTDGPHEGCQMIYYDSLDSKNPAFST